MFSKAKNSEEAELGLVEIDDDVLEQQPARKPKKERVSKAAAAPAKKNSNTRTVSAPSIISADVVITGSIEADGEVQFDGTIDGNLKASHLTIGAGATVRGEVIADILKVAGTVDGTIRANKVELASSAVVKGDIMHAALSIEEGARFEGNCRHSENPQAEDVIAKPAPVKRAPRTVAAAEEDTVSDYTEEQAPARKPAEAKATREQAPRQELVSAGADMPPPRPTSRPTANLRSIPADHQARSTANFLSRSGKTDLR